MKKYCYILSFLSSMFFLTHGFAQINRGGTPYSLTQDFEKAISQSFTVPVVSIASPTETELRDALENNMLPPNAYAKAIYVDYDMQNSGNWVDLPNGDRLWMLRIQSQDAISLHLTCENFWLPTGAKMFVYNDLRKEILGAFTSINNKAHGVFTTAVLEGDHLIIEYLEPAAVRGQGRFSITRIDYGFKKIDWEVGDDEASEILKAIFKEDDTSGTCNINIRCPEADDWQLHKRSVARISISTSQGSGLCSGALVNNTSFDGKPYFQTAWHCERVPSGGTINYQSWQFRFNFEATDCAFGSTPTVGNTTVGCTFKARVPSADYVLVELDDLPNSFEPYFLGWNRENVAPTSVVGIHHPGGNPKKFSFSNGPVNTNASTSTFSGGFEPLVIPEGNLWVFAWAQDGGTTQGGSSGSPLLDQNGRSVGVLTGGSSSCTNQQGGNSYGKMFSAWSAVAEFLDPIGTGETVIDGFDPITDNLGITALAPLVSECELSDATPFSITVRNSGANTQSDIPGYFIIRNNLNEVIQEGALLFEGNISSGEIKDFTFNFDLQERITYNISVSIQLPQDVDPSNDSRQISIVNRRITVPASNVSIINLDINRMRIDWTAGNGELRLVLVKEDNPFTENDFPNNGEPVFPSLSYGSSLPVGDAYPVYVGSAKPITVNNLQPDKTYYVAVVEYACEPPFYFNGNNPIIQNVITNLEDESNLVQGEMTVFPNPAEDYIQINLGARFNQQQNISLHLIDKLGCEVKVQNVFSFDGEATTRINTSNLPSGIYFLRVQSGETITTKKVILK